MEEAYTLSACVREVCSNASSEEGRLAVNGMSYHARAGENANSAIIVTVTPEDYGSEHPLAGMEFQRKARRTCLSSGRRKNPGSETGRFLQKSDQHFVWKRRASDERGICVWRCAWNFPASCWQNPLRRECGSLNIRSQDSQMEIRFCQV